MQKGSISLSRVTAGLVLPIEGDVAGIAQKAERLGYEYLAAPEHIAFHAPVPNSFIWLSAASGATRTIQLVSTVALPPLYPSVLFAKMVCSLDYLSGGRFCVGVGVGGEYAEEFRAAGVPLAERGPRTDEALDVLKVLLEASEPANYSGKFTEFEAISLAPKLGRGCPPIWAGGRSVPAMRRAARYADVWMPYMFSPEQTAAGRANVQAFAREYERPADSIDTGIYLFAVVSDDEVRGREQAVRFASHRYQQDFRSLSHKFLIGSPGSVLARIHDYIAVGVSTFILELACPPAEYEEQMERIAREIIPFLPGTAAP
jgi:alkanesulfonate monooxygenase SsuD/methylene tetrahydromethanopterin reductase-like flavin-dependent oxidoreductase (luciferase family)